jgi:integrase/recombinase XerD
MKFQVAIEGFIIIRSSDGASPHTIKAYQWGLNQLSIFLGNPEIETVTAADLRRWLMHLRERGLTESSVQVGWRTFRAFFSWASDASAEFHFPRPDGRIPKPAAAGRAVIPFTDDEVHRLIKACEYTAPSAESESRKPFQMHRPTANRDKAIVMVLVDTGLRVSECARLTIADVNVLTGDVEVKPYLSGRKSRGRTVHLGKHTRKALWIYLSSRGEPEDQEDQDPLFTTENNQPMDRGGNAYSLLKLLRRLGDRAGVKNVHPHRFRHTFAIQYLRNGGDVFTLQRLLGHRSLSMVRVYLDLADSDSSDAHRKASPVDRWKL